MSPAPPTISLTLTVHNKAWLLPRVLRGLLDNCSPQTRELVIVFDGCTDDSSAVAAATLAARHEKNLSIKTLTTPDVWETKANNVGLRGSSGDYVVIVQDDVVCTEKHFDQRLLSPLLRYPDCFAVGGNCTHHNQLVEGRLQWTELVGKSAWGRRFGWMPHLARALHRRHRLRYRKIFAVRDIVNRSPVLFDHDRLRKLNYFDESFSPLEFDDHDLCLRARRRFGWRCGGCLVDFQSDESWGQLRRSSTSAEVARRARAKNQAQLIERHRDLLLAPKITENRPLA